MRLTVSLPCYGRPERTKRSITNIIGQNINGWEAYILGDGCPHFQKLVESGYMFEMSIAAAAGGNRILYHNFPENMGGCGYSLTNYAIQHAKGKYLIFFANDDVILPNHFNNYLQIEKTDNDYMYFDSFLDPIKQVRHSKLAPSHIGHSEIIVKTSIAKECSLHRPVYGHDWDFISEVVSRGKGSKTISTPTYHIMHIPAFGTKDLID